MDLKSLFEKLNQIAESSDQNTKKLTEGQYKNWLHDQAEKMSREEFVAKFEDEFPEAGEFWDACCGDLDESVAFPVPTRQMTNDDIQEMFYDFAKQYASDRGITDKNDILAIASLAMETSMSSGDPKEAAAKFARRIKNTPLGQYAVQKLQFPVPTRQMTNDQIEEMFYNFAEKYAAKKGITDKNDILAITNLAMETSMSSGDPKEAAAKFARKIKSMLGQDVAEGMLTHRDFEKPDFPSVQKMAKMAAKGLLTYAAKTKMNPANLLKKDYYALAIMLEKVNPQLYAAIDDQLSDNDYNWLYFKAADLAANAAAKQGVEEEIHVPTTRQVKDYHDVLGKEIASDRAGKKADADIGNTKKVRDALKAQDDYGMAGTKYDRKYKEGVSEGEMSTRIGDKGETIRKHTAKAGGYGRKIDKDDESGDAFHSSDIDDSDEVKKSEPTAKRGRGRPMKGGDSDTGIVKKYDTDTLASWIIGNKPKNIGNIGKVSVKHKLKDWMEHVERKQIVEGYVAEGKMNELSMIIDDIVNGQLDIYDIISGRYVPTNDVESFVKRVLTREYDNIAADRGLHADDDHEKIIEIMYNEIHEIMNKALTKDLDEAEQVTIEPAKTSTQVIKQGSKVLGQVTNPQLAATIKQAIGTGQMTLAGNPQMHESVSTDKSIVNESTLEEIIGNYPHEHKMCQEGWGMDESLYSTLCDHYYKEGRIPRSVWHGSAEQLRDWVEECYLKDTQALMGENRERDLRKDAMSNLIDELDEDFMMDESEESIANQGIEAAHLDDNEVEVHPFKQTIDMDPIRGLETIRDFKQMNESKKPSAGLSKAQKSEVVKKAKSGQDIGKAGKGFEKIAKDAAERYGSKEKGEKVAAAAMWKNVPRESVEEGKEEDWDAAALAAGKRGRDARDNPSLAVALRKKSQSSRDAAKELEKLRQSHRDIEESVKSDDKAEKAGKKVTKDLEYDMYHTGKDDNKAEKAGKKVTKDIEYDEKLNEKFGKEASVDPEKKGMFKGKTKAELQKQYNKLKASGPHKSGSAENTKMKELAFAIRAKSGWGKVQESSDFSQWNNQLSSLINNVEKPVVAESKQIEKPMINENVELSNLLKFAGFKDSENVMEELNASIYGDAKEHSEDSDSSDTPTMPMPKGMGMSQHSEEEQESKVVEPMMNDEVISGLNDGSEQSDDDHLSFFKKMLTHGEKVHEDNYDSTQQSGIPASTSQSPISGQSSKEPVTEKEDQTESVSEGRDDDEDPWSWGHGGPKGLPQGRQARYAAGEEDDEGWDDEEVDEGNAFTGALAKAKADGIQPGETMKVGGKEYPVKEESVMTGNGDDQEEQSEVSSDAVRDAGLAQGDKDFFSSENSSTMAECDDQMNASSDQMIGDLLSKFAQLMGAQQPRVIDVEVEQPMDQDYAEEDPEHTSSCGSCGETMYEGHKCMESLNEWANSPEGQSADEQFQTDMEFMTKVISGGLNNQKQDQTTLPSTRVVTQDERKETDNTIGSMLRKLSGIN